VAAGARPPWFLRAPVVHFSAIKRFYSLAAADLSKDQPDFPIKIPHSRTKTPQAPGFVCHAPNVGQRDLSHLPPLRREIPAKHEGMNEKSSPQSRTPGAQSQLTRITRLLQRAQDSLHSALGASPSYSELEEWTAVPEGTIKYWYSNKGLPTAEFLLQVLERIPEKQRHDLLDSACRVYPSLEHPRLKCDHTILSRLRTIVCQSGGLVIVQGSNDESRTFMLTALGHAFLGLTASPHGLVGLDAHESDWFVPLPGVRYLDNLFQPAKLLQAARDNWPKVQARGTQLVLLNAIGVLMADFQRPIKALTARCPVIIAEAAQIKPSLLKRASHGPVHIVTVYKHPENAKGIALNIDVL
jgi:hypothetical protein